MERPEHVCEVHRGEFLLSELAYLRATAYRLVSQAFLNPVAAVAEAVRRLAIELSHETGGEQLNFAQRLSHCCVSLLYADEARLQQLQARYVALFGATAHGLSCPPLESAYRRGSSGREGFVIAAVERDYATAGVFLSRSHRLPPDHISLEMEFMAVLCGREAEAWASEDSKSATRLLEKERRFLAKHVLSWLPAFAADLRDADLGGTYSQITAAGYSFVRHDLDLSEELAVVLGTNGGSR